MNMTSILLAFGQGHTRGLADDVWLLLVGVSWVVFVLVASEIHWKGSRKRMTRTAALAVRLLFGTAGLWMICDAAWHMHTALHVF